MSIKTVDPDGLLPRYADTCLPYIHQTFVTHPRPCDHFLPLPLSPSFPFPCRTFHLLSRFHFAHFSSSFSLFSLKPHSYHTTLSSLSRHISSPLACRMTHCSSSSRSTHTKFRFRSSLPHSGCLSLIPFLRTAHCSQVSPLSLSHLSSLNACDQKRICALRRYGGNLDFGVEEAWMACGSVGFILSNGWRNCKDKVGVLFLRYPSRMETA